MSNEHGRYAIYIPEGFHRISEQHSNTGNVTVETFFNSDLREYYVKVSSFNREGEPKQSLGGPFMMADLDIMSVAFADIISMRERYGRI